MDDRSAIYVGEILHARSRPLAHAFRYPMWMLAVDVDQLDGLDRRLRLFGHSRRRPVALHDADYLGSRDDSLRDKLARRLQAAGVSEPPRRIMLVTMPRVLGHAFNPVSLYYCYDGNDQPLCCVAEVNNTFGEGHVYVLPCARAQAAAHPDGEQPAALHWRVAKEFHVSPFNAVAGEYAFRFAPLGERLDVGIDLQVDGEPTLVTRLSGEARRLDDVTLALTLLRYPLVVALTVPRILRQAATLHGSGLAIHAKPEPCSERTFKATRPAYISELGTSPRIEGLVRRFVGTGGETP
jgi:cyclopropane-fatty-acyl-phospholipid synthase